MASKKENSTSPARRPPQQAKSSRQQFSACGACRMRRVRCDLKDLQAASPSAGLAACSNCQERGLKCVDEFAEVKAVKLLRRGRRLQQVEAVYGKAAAADGRRFPSPTALLTQPSCISRLRPEFYRSSFFHTFLIQRPIIDPLEFSCRVFEAHNGNPDALGPVGQLLCMVFAAWAASFGINEAGEPESNPAQHGSRVLKDRTNPMVRELLQLVDLHGLLRKPTWDGVRVLLLLMPLTEDVQSPLERLAMYEAAVNQVYTLCSLAPITSVNSGQGEYMDAAIRARIFWYAHVHEGVTTGLRGGRLLLTDDDFAAFQTTLPPLNAHMPPNAANYSLAYRFAKIPTRLSSICRQVHMALTGPKARQNDDIDADRLHYVWRALQNAWEELESLRHCGTADYIQPHDVERYINSWHILVFECYNVIREALKQRLIVCSDNESTFLPNGGASRSARLTQVMHLHAISNDKCQHFARRVASIIRRQVGRSFFDWDASLVRDGCFYAGAVLAGESGSEEDVRICLQALREMRWAFSKCEERENTLKIIWEQRVGAESHRRPEVDIHPNDVQDSAAGSFTSTNTTSEGTRLRHTPPPLIIGHTTLCDSAPTTAVASDDGGWSLLPSASSVHTHRSSSGSPPFTGQSTQHLNPKVEALSLGLGVHEHAIATPVYYQQEIDTTFAYSIVPNNSASTPRSPHDFTPPCSSAGISTSSINGYQDSFFDSAGSQLFTVSPPGSAPGTADSSNLSSDKGTAFHVSYSGSPFYVTP